jgi:hypothetical protein
MAGPRRVAGSAVVRPPARPTGEIGKGRKVCRARGEVAELKSYTNLTRTQQRGEGGSSLEMNMMAALAQLSSGKGEEMAEAGVRNWGARGGPFIGTRGEKGARGGEHRRACHGGDGGAQWRRRDGSGRCKAPNRDGERDNGEVTGRAVAGGDRVASPVTGARKGLTSGGRLPEGEKDRERARGVRLTGGARLATIEREGSAARGRWATWAAKGGGVRALSRERGRVWAGNGPVEGVVFLFVFLFSIYYFYFFYLLFF